MGLKTYKMYSGYDLFMGIQVWRNDLNIYLGHEVTRYDLNFKDVNKKLFEDGYKMIQFYRKPCCFGDDTLYFGIHLGDASFVYRDEGETFDSFEEYHNQKMKELLNIKDTFGKIDKDLLTKEIKDFSIKYIKKKEEKEEKDDEDSEDEEETLSDDIQFHLIANDCDRCS
jgi:hypothetical protein